MKWTQKQQQDQIFENNEQQRAEKLAELGSTLRRHRQEKQLTLEQIEAQTRIRARFLQAIEAGKLDQLPEPVYIQSFIKKYAQTLGLDGTQLASTFPVSDRPQTKTHNVNLPAAQLHTTHLYALYIFVIVCAVSALSQTLNRFEPQVGNTQLQKQPAISTAAKPKPTKAAQKVKPVNALSKSNKPVQVGLTLKDESWIRVVADGKKQFEGLLPQGTVRTWVADEQLTVRVGNAGGVLVSTVEQKAAKPLGQPGQVQEVTFAPKTRL